MEEDAEEVSCDRDGKWGGVEDNDEKEDEEEEDDDDDEAEEEEKGAGV